ncbi:MAG: LamG domain-containing protein [Flavisolibacter sp.]
MNLTKNTSRLALFILVAGFMVTSCQKKTRPELKELILDPDPPAYSDLKSFWDFENNLTDKGENKLTPTSNNVSFVTGINGQAVNIGTDGYILFTATGDTVKYANGYKGLPADTLKNLGSYTLSFWMNGVGPVKNGAEGLFSISNKNEFWGNLDLFLENDDNPADQSEAYLKVHMFNNSVSSGNGEEWNEVKIPGGLNKWTHIAVTYNASNSQFSIYADGQPTAVHNKVLGGGSYGKLTFKDFNGMVIGTYQFQTNPSLTNHGPESWARSFIGSLDQFRIYNRALSDSEINDLFTTKK